MNPNRLFRRTEPLTPDAKGIKHWLWPAVAKAHGMNGKRAMARRKRQIERGMIKVTAR